MAVVVTFVSIQHTMPLGGWPRNGDEGVQSGISDIAMAIIGVHMGTIDRLGAHS